MRCSRGRMVFSAAVLSLALWPCASLFAQDYEIRLHRPLAVGQKFHLSASGRYTATRTIRAGANPAQTNTAQFAVECEGDVTVLAVDDKGKPSRLSLQLEKFTRTDDKTTMTLPKGSIVAVMMKDDAEVAQMDGHNLPQWAQQAITVALPLDPPNSPTEDELYGVKGRKKAGDHWDINAQAFAQDLQRRGGTTNPSDLSGAVTLDKAVAVGKTDCLQISGVLTCDKFVPTMPREVKLEKGSLKIRFAEKLPIALTMPAVEESREADIAYTMTGRPEATADEVTVDVHMVMSRVSHVGDVQTAAEPAK